MSAFIQALRKSERSTIVVETFLRNLAADLINDFFKPIII